MADRPRPRVVVLIVLGILALMALVSWLPFLLRERDDLLATPGPHPSRFTTLVGLPTGKPVCVDNVALSPGLRMLRTRVLLPKGATGGPIDVALLDGRSRQIGNARFEGGFRLPATITAPVTQSIRKPLIGQVCLYNHGPPMAARDPAPGPARAPQAADRPGLPLHPCPADGGQRHRRAADAHPLEHLRGRRRGRRRSHAGAARPARPVDGAPGRAVLPRRDVQARDVVGDLGAGDLDASGDSRRAGAGAGPRGERPARSGRRPAPAASSARPPSRAACRPGPIAVFEAAIPSTTATPPATCSTSAA